MYIFLERKYFTFKCFLFNNHLIIDSSRYTISNKTLAIIFKLGEFLQNIKFQYVENVKIIIKIKNDIWNRQKDRVCVCVIEHFKITKYLLWLKI